MNCEKGSQNVDNDQICYGIVGNIPSELHSADVRAFFSQFVEEKGFLCFHYRHRPEVQKDKNKQRDSTQNTKKTPSTCCCIVKLYKEKMDGFMKAYNGQNWVDKAGKLFSQKALISKIRLDCTIDDSESYLTKQEKLQNTRTREEFAQDDLRKLPELNPPSIMPNGNVGTPLFVFIDLIRKCKFPPHLIKKLGLNFPRSKKRKYGNVPFDYEGTVEKNEPGDDNDDDVGNDNSPNPQLSHELASEMSQNAKKAEICFENKNSRSKLKSSCDIKTSSDSMPANISMQSAASECLGQKSGILQKPEASKTLNHSNSTKRKLKRSFKEDMPHLDENPKESDSSDGELEEWDRHETLHNDVTSQERTKERLFEDYIELKWEKGGSGLVWYTDAAFWKQQEEADFDEETVDDWDVDMNIYEEEGGGDMDAKALLQLRLEKQWRKGSNIDVNRVGSFEKHTRGIAGRVMRKQGWKEGQSLGSSQVGITEPIPSDGQKPTSKRGLGYYGEKLKRCPKKARPTREAVISTVYDEKEEKSVELLHSEGPYAIKYRDNIEFVPEKEKASKNGT